MAHEIEFTFNFAQTDLWAAIFKNDSGTMKVNIAGGDTWEVWNNLNTDTYNINLVEAGGGKYTADFPSIAVGNYSIVIYQGDLVNPSVGSIGADEPIGGDSVYWDGTNLTTSVNLESILTTEPTGRATTFREMIIQLYMRFFNKVDKTTTQIRVYDESGTVNTTQSHTDVTSVTTVNKAS